MTLRAMRIVTARELIAATHSAAVPAAGLVSLTVSAAFVLAWSPGVSLFAPLSFYAQARAVHWIVLSAVLPYAVVRSSPIDHKEAIELVAALSRIRPGAAMIAKVLGSFTVAMVVIVAGIPALVLAQQAAAIPVLSVAADLMRLAGLALLVAAAATAATLLARDGLRAWLWASGVVIVVTVSAAAWLPRISGLAVLCGLIGATATAVLSTLAAGSVPSQDTAHGE